MGKSNLDRRRTIEINAKILEAEILVFQEELWENNDFCTCGGEDIYQCSCDPDKKRRFRKRRSRKTNEEFSERLDHALKEKLPPDFS